MPVKVFFLMDAFSSDYLSEKHTPFLYDCANKGEYTKKIIPGFGYCERAEIFTGVSSQKSNYISAIGFNPDKSPYKNLSILLNLISAIDRYISIRIFRKILRRLLSLLIYRFEHPLNPYQIPYKLLKYFSLTEDYNNFLKPHALKYESIFDIAAFNSKKIHQNSFTGLNKKNNGTDNDRLERVLRECSEEYSLYLIYISIMDATGHKYGPKSKEVKEALYSLDCNLMNFVARFDKKMSGSEYIFLGDHGMTTIKSKIDVKEIISGMDKTIKTRLYRDYIFFLDSTMLRVWLLNENFRIDIEEYLLSHVILNKKGVFYSKANDENLNRELGDIVWCANSGILISPDFFHTGAENLIGMHGYLNPKEGGAGMCIKFGNIEKKVIDERDLHSVFNDLVDSVQ